MFHELSDTEKARISAEERWRLEIRTQLTEEAGKKRRFVQKASDFLNSAFGIWLLSAVCVSAAGSWYTQSQNAAIEAARKRDTERGEQLREKELHDRLALEISFRFSSTMARLRGVWARFGEDVGAQSQAAIGVALEPMVRPAGDAWPPLFPEFRSYSGLALIAEMRRHAAPGEQERLREVLARTSGLLYEAAGESCLLPRSARAVARLLLEHMSYARWNNGFPFTDCPPDTPFC